MGGHMTDIIEGAVETPRPIETPGPVAASRPVEAPRLVATPQFSESALEKPRPTPPQLAVQQIAALAVATSAVATLDTSPQALAAVMPAPSNAPSLRTRVAAFAVMKQCLRVQSAAQPRSRVARVLGREPLHPDARSWYRGALGELEVARILSRLDRRWTVLHAVPVGQAGADIDHVLVGPGGTFTINTKNHSGKKIWTAGTTFMVDGQKLAHIHNSTFEAKRAARLLSDVAATPVAVTPLIVVVRPQSVTRRDPDVTVLESADLLRWLTRQPQMQTDATVARIVWAAERRETWTTLDDDHEQDRQAKSTHRQRTARAERPEVDYADEFARLRSEVETAESRRQAWSLLGSLALLAAIVGAGMALIPMLPNLLAGVLGG